MNYFDNFGWKTTEIVPDRQTEISIPDEALLDGNQWNFTGYEWIQRPLVVPSVILEQNHHITKRAFRNRFTQAEEISIEIAQLDNPNASMTDRAKAAALRAAQRKVSDSPYVDLKLDQTIQGVQMLEAVGLLATGRANAILNNPISDEERYKE